MNLSEFTHLLLELDSRNVLTVKINRPEVHNAFNEELITNLLSCAKFIETSNVRVVILTGVGKSFCAGADLKYMQKSRNYNYDQNVDDARHMSDMFTYWNNLSKPVIGRINGSVIGGGNGLLSACDIAIASNKAKFGFSEVKLGLVPAVISQFVISKIGITAAREYFITGARFKTQEALKMGLINYAVESSELDTIVEKIANQLLTSGPNAIQACKKLIMKNIELNQDDLKEYSIKTIAELRTSDEGIEGINSFLEKRKAKWIKE